MVVFVCLCGMYLSCLDCLHNQLNDFNTNHSLPWMLIGDFNMILDSHEKISRSRPCYSKIQKFQEIIQDVL